MSKKSPQDILLSLSKQYAEKATQISVHLEKAEKILQRMPGKTVVSSSGSGGFSMTFRKLSGHWRLVWERNPPMEACAVNDSPMEIKIAAANLLPALFENLLPTFRKRASDIKKSLDALEKMPFFADNE